MYKVKYKWMSINLDVEKYVDKMELQEIMEYDSQGRLILMKMEEITDEDDRC